MATSITCDMCGDETAVVMVTNLGNGDTLAYGQACQLTFYLTVARELITGMTPDVLRPYAQTITDLVTELTSTGPATGTDRSRQMAREQHGDLCPECGIAWDQPSPACPHQIWDLHPLPPAEGVTDEHTATPPGPDVTATGTPDGDDGPVHQPARRGTRRPG